MLWPKETSACMLGRQRLTLCGPMGRSPPGSSVHGIFLARILEWIAMSSRMGSSRPRDWTCVSCIAGGFFITELPGKPRKIPKGTHVAEHLHFTGERAEALGEYSNLLKAVQLCSFFINTTLLPKTNSNSLRFSHFNGKILVSLLKHLKLL